MAETFDIITEEGGRLVTCVKEGGNVIIRGKEGNLSLSSFMAQISNPSLAKQMKGKRLKGKAKEPSRQRN